MKVLYAGSFDPITLGHLDIIERASKVFETVVVAVMDNDLKKSLFSVDEKIDLIMLSVAHLSNVTVVSDTGLTINLAKRLGCSGLLRGIRAVADYEYELAQATTNRLLDSSIETVFFVASPKYISVSSSSAKTIAHFGGPLSHFVPPAVQTALLKKQNSK